MEDSVVPKDVATTGEPLYTRWINGSLQRLRFFWPTEDLPLGQVWRRVLGMSPADDACRIADADQGIQHEDSEGGDALPQ